MKKSQKILILFIIIVFIIIISLLLLLLLQKEPKDGTNKILNQTTEKTENFYIEEKNDDIKPMPATIENKIKYVNDRTTYFTINALYNNYINLIGYQQEEGLKKILSPQYISKYKITNNNIFNQLTVPKTDNDKQYYKTVITEMLSTQIDDTTDIYIVKGNCRIVGKDIKFSVQAMFEINTTNGVYIVYPYQYMKDNGYDKLKVEDTMNYTPEKIEGNNNKFGYITKSDKEMANEYFYNYRELLEYYPDEAYNKLDSEYRQKRFGSKENFETYLKDNQILIALMSINEYKITAYQDYTDYICSDKYNNIYIFRQQGGVMRYTVFLDNYTILQGEEKEYYDNLDNKFDKSIYNITKFIKMVNTKDYNAIYSVLDSSFKSNQFKNVKDLKQYIKNNMYDINSIEIENYDDKTYEYYIFKCTITNLRNKNQTKKINIIINQSEGTDFTMSFSFQ